MNAYAHARYYDRLTPEERFRLHLAAEARGDRAEQAQLTGTARRLRLSLPDHAPYHEAFDELALVVFVELLEDAARYLEAFQRADDANFIGAAESAGDDTARDNDEGAVPSATGEKSAEQRCLDIALAAGYALRAKVDGWKLFCTRLTLPPFVSWERLPGFERLQRALALAAAHEDYRSAVFTADEMLRWLNGIRPKGEPALTAVALTAEAVARETEELFRQEVIRHGGRKQPG